MSKNTVKAEKNKQRTDRSDEDKKFPLPVYNEEDDIYSRDKEVRLKDEDDSEEIKPGNNNNNPGEDLDIPGAESDDLNEAIGEEDEENNYYSLGGDGHNDLEEDNG